MSRLPKAVLAAVFFAALAATVAAGQPHSVARQWNEALLEAIRQDFARPTIHARNLYHVSAAMWDAWAAYDQMAEPVLADERAAGRGALAVAAARAEAISYAAYRVLSHRYRDSAPESVQSFTRLMETLGYDAGNTAIVGQAAAAVGNRIALAIIDHGLTDGADERGAYAFGRNYSPSNPPLVVRSPGVGDLQEPSRWQPLALRVYIDQAGRRLPSGIQKFLGSHWGEVTPFALTPSAATSSVYLDPGPPPDLLRDTAAYRHTFAEVLRYGVTLTPDDGAIIDISPGQVGANSLGANDGNGHAVNPTTGRPYPPNVVKRGDWARVIAEFWADGPDSETPPGHWNALANYITDHPATERRFRGLGPALDPLEWDVKLYLALNGAVHDAAVCAWGIKGHYDYVRPITAIRHMAELGQSSDPALGSYNPLGLELEPGLVELITAATSSRGQRHAHLAEHVGAVAVHAWRGEPDDPESQYSGVGWILGTEWLPYQRSTFVTPPFAGYISGHSTFSRAAAEVLAGFTGSEYFPGGVGEFVAPMHDFLVFESGPSAALTLQWATYYDAADEAGISRLYGGIHPAVDDLPGRIIGATIGKDALARAVLYFG